MRNRIETGPMSIVEMDAKECLTDQAIAFYEGLAAGGAAVVTIGESIVRTENGKTHAQQLMLGRDEVKYCLQKVADAIHAHGALANIEISHGGCMADPRYNNGNKPIGPVSFIDEWGDEIVGMDEEMMDDVANAFAEAVETVRNCGFDMAMIHCGHGWLLHQFLSPYYNTRTDEYGGSIEGRAKFPIMVIDRIRERVGRGIALDMRISGSEFIEGGLEIDDVVKFCKMVENKVDMINVSAGAPWTKRMAISIFEERGINSEFAAAVKKQVTKIPVTAVGGYTDPELMEKHLKEGRADAFVLGRSILADPMLPHKARTDNAATIHRCLRCYVCNEAQYHENRTLYCTINPTAGREYEAKMFPPPAPRRKVLVAGGGPAGMEAAITAARRGHEVALYEKTGELGGTLKFARHIPFKKDVQCYAETLERELRAEKNVRIYLNTPVTKKLIEKEKPDLVIAAIGADPLIPPIKGLDNENVVYATDMFDADVKIGKKVVIIGGGLVGCESGLHLANEDHDVTIIEMRDEVAIDATHDHRRFMMPLLEEKVNCARSLTVCEVTADGVRAKANDGTETFFTADTVILAAGMKAKEEEAESLRDCSYDFVRIGDCLRARKIYNAVREGFDAGMFVR
ncbi:MAG TPA: FAD-dependent oxidoreductase [Clostridiales bacterium]|nr:FAD-dependent oxidoreductase [Clostridiales bacterium]